jgi:hypothetical protein
VIRLAKLFEKIPAWITHGIKFNLDQANLLPEDGIPEGLSAVVDEEAVDPEICEQNQDDGPVVEEVGIQEDTVVFIEHNGPVDQEALIRDTLWPQDIDAEAPPPRPVVQEPLNFPIREETPLNEFEETDLFTLVFPTLFPLGIYHQF